jgi:hypothetical protein
VEYLPYFFFLRRLDKKDRSADGFDGSAEASKKIKNLKKRSLLVQVTDALKLCQSDDQDRIRRDLSTFLKKTVKKTASFWHYEKRAYVQTIDVCRICLYHDT